ncbi:MAG: type ISP restriction/modification enzyme [Fluviicoccus sp.]|uniref:DEAD/DEAH box helicase n=1 Tax=Fluviicoccus sp. TaxID=2003552 RepID=UPI0027219253|nr:type ISP restriction/modification enzyme [Fluviicoccus sp.]MDO8330310.1 type ISP restriction/modification enzyme [Fluviicoccus sp.]
MTALQQLLNTFRQAAVTEREKGTYFEELICCYLRNEATYRDLYSDVWTYAEWAQLQGINKQDAGIDLVAKTQGTDEIHAIQCKFFAEDYKVQKADIDSFFTASGKKPFTHRIIVTTTSNWSSHANDALSDQHTPVSKIDLQDLENSQIDWSLYQPKQAPVLKAKKSLRDHQKQALAAVEAGLQTADRGKLIMACGTGKTFTSLKIAEKLAGKGKRVLFLVPSLSLLSQTLTEWTQESETPLHSFAVCSDSDVGNKRKKDEDVVQTYAHELRYPATTEPSRLAKEMTKRHDAHHMSVVFSTYHSIDVISKAQLEHQLADFDLIICDEAHRTTGATFDTEDESNFVKVHDASFIHSAKRLYMTATPRIYGDMAKASAEKDNVALCSMDDVTLYGHELYVITFSEAVKRELLVDYKVIVLSVDEAYISKRLQNLLKDEDNQLKVDDAAKIIGCWKALSKQGTQEILIDDTDPMRRAVAFCQVIEPQYKGNTHKVSSKNIASMFQAVVDAYQEQEALENPNPTIESYLLCEAEHVDGGMNASKKEEKLAWLKEELPENTCRILSNVRCLSEGVDVPALDAVLFLTPRNSQVDVVQSVGRVMRRAEGKKRGYVILPVVIPAGVEPHEALNDNKTYKVVWQVLQALRSHDDRFDAMINKLDLNLNAKMLSKMEVIAITDKINPKTKQATGTKNKDAGKGSYGIGSKQPKHAPEPAQHELTFEIGEIERAIYAKVVQKCGNRSHWEDWANDIAKIANTHITRIQTILDNPENTSEIEAFKAFAVELRDDLNNAITDGEIVEMLAQHLITKPVFDALFQDYSFAKFNPMSIAMQDILDKLEEHRLAKEADTLQRFYDSVKMRAEGIDNAAGKQKIVVELYDKFFRNAFPRLTERLGIVYTPVEVVDFIIHSVNDILKSEFGQTLGDKNVHIVDPFTGTGTFITRLLQSGLISDSQLPYKYKNEIHANEIVLLAYYIAAINIEAVYHDIILDDYAPFNGICLTDTFQMYEKEDLVDQLLVQNSKRRQRQKQLDIRVIIGNPPYSVGQKSENDNNDNVDYPHLDARIKMTFADRSNATSTKSLYDSYIRAIRWASDRIGNSGIIGFVTNAGFIEAAGADGMRKSLSEEFSSIFIFHLRGNQRTSGELSRKEGGKIFGGGSRAPIAISILVKNPSAAKHGQIHLHDIGDYLTREQKLKRIQELNSISGITEVNGWTAITPDEHGDWLRQRDDSFSNFIALGDKKNDHPKLLANFSQGVLTSRDAWCYNSSKTAVENNICRMISFYNNEVERFFGTYPALPKKEMSKLIDNFVDIDSTKISWSSSLKDRLLRGQKISFDDNCLVPSVTKPFTNQWLYFSEHLNHRLSQLPHIFPSSASHNLVICVPASGGTVSFCALITDKVPGFKFIGDGGTQCFPLYLYSSASDASSSKKSQASLFESDTTPELSKKYSLTDEGLAHFKENYPNETISHEDVFYYVYGLFHSKDYISLYSDNLGKELPRIPCVKSVEDFWKFSKAGRALAELHINFETVKPYPVNIDCGKSSIDKLDAADFNLVQMKFAKKSDKSVVIYNSKITIKDIPTRAYDYIVNGRSALDWIMDRQTITTNKDSGIVNDANDWAIETMGNPRYPLDLFQRVITVSLETLKIVESLPKLNI